MRLNRSISSVVRSMRMLPLLAVLAGTPAWAQAGDKAARYGTPEEALKALTDAAQAKDMAALTKVFGAQLKELLSGDKVEDATELDQFAANIKRGAKLEKVSDDEMSIAVGADGNPFPVPLVKEEGKWFFDTEEGKEEVLNRRVGENELRTIAVCRGYVEAQREYFAQDRDGDNVLEFAQRMASTPGAHDGLYWEVTDGGPPSPLGPLVAKARSEGYSRENKNVEGATPYFGYVYKAFTAQGGNAPGGAYSYIINGNQVAGFALMAYPVEWGKSGVMSFMVGPNGVVLEKNLGEKTAEAAAAMTAFDPDSSWTASAP